MRKHFVGYAKTSLCSDLLRRRQLPTAGTVRYYRQHCNSPQKIAVKCLFHELNIAAIMRFEHTIIATTIGATTNSTTLPTKFYIEFRSLHLIFGRRLLCRAPSIPACFEIISCGSAKHCYRKIANDILLTCLYQRRNSAEVAWVCRTPLW